MKTNTYEVVIKEDGFAYIYLDNRFIGKARAQYLYATLETRPE
jgi:hypothetical protein